MTDEELIESLRLWNRDDAADRIKQLAVTNEALSADLARSTRMIAKMVPLSADGNYVFWDGVGDIELDHNGELRKTIEALEAKLGEQNLLWQAYDGDLYQAYVDANEARIDAEAKLAECEARLRKAVDGLRVISQSNAVTSASQNVYSIWRMTERARATLAEISSEAALNKGESHE